MAGHDGERSALHPSAAVTCVAAVVAAVALIFAGTTGSLIEQWSQSTTYSHGFVIVPLFAALVWSRRGALATLPMRPNGLGLFAVAAAALLWLVGEAVAAAAPAQLALVAMVPSTLLAIAGTAWLRALAFPLAYLFFAVPVGDSLVQPMIDRTADFTVGALVLSGIPVFRDGTHFSIPTGDWSVIDACSGVRYLFAGLALATLYAWLAYRTNRKRVLFVLLTVAALVVANWLRAYAIVMIAHHTDNRFALGIDHFIYGGVFFGAVMFAAFALGARWRDHGARLVRQAGPDVVAADAKVGRSARWPTWAAALAVATVLALPSAALRQRDGAAGSRPVPRPLRLAEQAGWIRLEPSAPVWEPHLRHPAAAQLERFERDGRQVGVHLARFGRPTPESKVFSSAHTPLAPDARSWQLVQQGSERIDLATDRRLAVNTAALLGRAGRLTAWQWFWVDGIHTASPTEAALRQLIARLTGRSEWSARVTVYVVSDGTDAAPPERVLQAFVATMLGAIDAALAESTGGGAGRQ